MDNELEKNDVRDPGYLIIDQVLIGENDLSGKLWGLPDHAGAVDRLFRNLIEQRIACAD